MSDFTESDIPAADAVLDATGLFCPEPVMLLHNAIRDLDDGRVLKVRATDPSTRRDIAKFCRFLNHQLLAVTEDGDELHFLIRKGPSADPRAPS